MSSNHLILYHSLLLLPSIFPSIRGFSSESVLRITWPKYWTFSISPSNEYLELISFRMDWFDLPQDSQESSPASQFKSISSLALCLLYGPTLTSIYDQWKNHSFDYMDLCWQSDVSAFNILFRFVTAFLPRSKHLLISWLQSLSAVIFEPKKIKPVTDSTLRHQYSNIFKAKQKSTLNWLSHKQHPDLNSL